MSPKRAVTKRRKARGIRGWVEMSNFLQHVDGPFLQFAAPGIIGRWTFTPKQAASLGMEPGPGALRWHPDPPRKRGRRKA